MIRNTIIVRTVDSGLLGKGNSQMKNYELIHLLQQLPYNYDVVVDLDSRTTYDAGVWGVSHVRTPEADDSEELIIL